MKNQRFSVKFFQFFANLGQFLIPLILLANASHCTDKSSNQQTCLGEINYGEGVEVCRTVTDIPCDPYNNCPAGEICSRDNSDCPPDESCFHYGCDGDVGLCFQRSRDRDEDGFISESCGGTDCQDCPGRERVSCPLDDPESCPWCGGVNPGAPEDCNLTDDDCDGEVDEGLEEPQSCTLDEDPCQTGQRVCRKGQWSCEGASGRPEICNGVDDDCDGEVDEGEVDEGLGKCCKEEFNLISTGGDVDECTESLAERAVEPSNSDFDTAPVLNDGATGLVFGEYQVCWPGDVDIYGWRVTSPRGEALYVTFEHNAGDLDAALYDSDRNLGNLAQSCDDNERLVIPAGHEREIWFIVVNGWHGATNAYRIRSKGAE